MLLQQKALRGLGEILYLNSNLIARVEDCPGRAKFPLTP